MDLGQIGNLIEALLWMSIGAAFFVSLRRPSWRRMKLAAGITFGVFGVTDVVEAWAGSMTDWLIAWKGVCVGALFVLLMLYTRSSRSKKR